MRTVAEKWIVLLVGFYTLQPVGVGYHDRLLRGLARRPWRPPAGDRGMDLAGKNPW
jgi:hypothetical protein